MKLKILAVALTSVLFTSAALGAPAAPAVNLTTDEAKLSYVFGLNMGMNLHMQQVAVDPNVFLQGLNAGLNGAAPAMTPAQIQETLKQFQSQMKAKQDAAMKALAAKNLQEGEAFMKANAAKPGVKTLADGQIQYKVVTEGKGSMPKDVDTINLTYEGKLVNGQVFDSTKRNGNKPVSLPLSHMIPGMKQVLMMMPVGSTWEVVIAPKLAYGEQGVPMSPIGPNETLVFSLTLNGITPGIAPTTPAKK